jgi:hypothetical protein
MRISFLPAGSEETASSRIRVHSVQRALVARGWEPGIGFQPRCDVLVVQKRVTEEILALARDAARRGAAILYDVDDLGPALDYWTSPAHFAAMLELADIVTTDTRGHRDFLKRDRPELRIEIIPDCIDYYPDAPASPAAPEGPILRLLWFGSSSNIGLLEKYVGALTSLPEVEVVVSTSAASVRDYAAANPRLSVLAWSRERFVEQLRSCHLTCLMHDGSEIDRAKSNNKMITSVGWGVPALVSRTPEYERTAREASIEDALFEEADELREVVERFRPAAARRGYLARAQGPIWSRYSPEAVGRLLVGVMESLVYEHRR